MLSEGASSLKLLGFACSRLRLHCDLTRRSGLGQIGAQANPNLFTVTR